jgi:RsiW-degrading membrane proteinase PrsW (M82 family)/tetratricopeptide (TPR) repeat protein
VVAWAARRLGWPITWRQGALALVAGSTLSIFVAILLEALLPYLAFLLVAPLGFLSHSFGEVFASGGPDILGRLFFSPLIVGFLIATALEAPIPEEFAKALGVMLFGRQRISDERRALMVGLACGAGFAILENMVYEGLYAQFSGWSWGGITLLRGLGAALHPIGTALVALGWFRMRESGIGTLFKAYLAAVGLHTLWNGGFSAFVYLTGLDYYGGLGPSLSIYGLAIEGLLVVFLVALSLGLWWLLRHLVTDLAKGIEPDLTPTIVTQRALAGWAFACALVIIPIGAALSPAWGQIQVVVLAGPPTPTPTAPPTATSTPTANLAATQQAQRNLEATATGQVVQATAVAASHWPIVLSDLFDANVNDWPTGEYSSEWITGGGRRITNGKYRWKAEARKGVVSRSQPDITPVSDFYLAVEARKLNGPENSAYGLIFRQRDGDYYFFRIRDDQRFRLALRYEGQWETVIDWTKTSAIRPNEVNRLTVLAEGSHFLFYINGHYAGEADDKRLSSGTTSVAIELDAGDEAIFEFDNFELRSPQAQSVTLLSQGMQLAQEGKIEEAIAAYAEAQKLDPSLEISSTSWNALCWFGGLWGYAADVITACERAVELAPGHGGIRDSRGLARALTGNYEGAIEDFKFFVEWSKENSENEQYGVKREAWIAELEAGRNPFDEATLEELQNE